MVTTSLATYGTPDGLTNWTLDDTIAQLDTSVQLKLLERARLALAVYGPYDLSKQYGSELLHELVYTLAEILWYRSRNVRTMVSARTSERIGSYSYTQRTDSAHINQLIEDDSFLWPVITYLRYYDFSPARIGIEVIPLLDYNPQTGMRGAVHGYTDRVVRAIREGGLISGTAEFNQAVYGDPWAWGYDGL